MQEAGVDRCGIRTLESTKSRQPAVLLVVNGADIEAEYPLLIESFAVSAALSRVTWRPRYLRNLCSCKLRNSLTVG